MKKIATAAISALAALLVLELGLHLARAQDAYRIYPPGLEQTFLPVQEIMPGVGPKARFSVNSLGFRGDELPEGPCYRILALGGSTTECAFVDQPLSWPRLVQTELEEARGECVWVANAGRSGFTSRRHVVQLRYLLEQEPRFDAILLLVGVNDLCQRLESGSEEPPTEELTPAGVALWQCFSVVPRGADPTTPLLKRTALYDFARGLKRLAPSAKQQDLAGMKYRTWRRNRRNASEFRNELPDLERALDAYRANLRECAELARAAETRLVLVTQPSLWRPELPPELRGLMWLGGTGDYQRERGLPYYGAVALAEGMRRYNDALREVAEEQGLELIDLAPEIPKDGSCFYDDVHFNDGGSRRVAEVIASFLLERAPFAASDG